MVKVPEYTPPNRTYRWSKDIYEKMFNATNHQRNAIKTTPVRKAMNNKSKNKCCNDVAKGEPFCTVGGNVARYSHCGKQCGNTQKIKNGSVF